MRAAVLDMLRGGLAGLALGALMGLGLPYPGRRGAAWARSVRTLRARHPGNLGARGLGARARYRQQG